jgi:hypothetical protein
VTTSFGPSEPPFDASASPILKYSPLPMDVSTPAWKLADREYDSDGSDDIPELMQGSDSEDEDDEPPALMENSDDEDDDIVPSQSAFATDTIASSRPDPITSRCNALHVATGHSGKARMINTIKSKGIAECGISEQDVHRYFEADNCLACLAGKATTPTAPTSTSKN